MSRSSACLKKMDDWKKQGLFNEQITQIRIGCTKQSSVGTFVLFSFGTVVYVTEDMIRKSQDKKEKTRLYLPKYHQILFHQMPHVITAREEFYANQQEDLKDSQRSLYRAAVEYMTTLEYPMPGSEESRCLLRLHETNLWSFQYRNHTQAIAYLPYGSAWTTTDAVCVAFKQQGLSMDQMTLNPSYIHTTNAYDSVDRSLDPHIWDPSSNEYTDPRIKGLRCTSSIRTLNSTTAAWIAASQQKTIVS